ncbi:MAG: hypothetical protein ACFFG0_43440 [Candidatus Thorarchaeota archaeon]
MNKRSEIKSKRNSKDKKLPSWKEDLKIAKKYNLIETKELNDKKGFNLISDFYDYQEEWMESFYNQRSELGERINNDIEMIRAGIIGALKDFCFKNIKKGTIKDKEICSLWRVALLNQSMIIMNFQKDTGESIKGGELQELKYEYNQLEELKAKIWEYIRERNSVECDPFYISIWFGFGLDQTIMAIKELYEEGLIDVDLSSIRK